MRQLALSIIACVALCAAAVVHAVERAIDYGLGLMPVTPPRLFFAGERVALGGFVGFADPHVERHEAGMSRRAAMRAI